MRYQMKQKVFCLGDDFTIRDEAGHDAFLVDGRAFSFGDKLSLQDMQGRELAFIAQKLLSWGPTYEIYRNNELFAVIKKANFTFFHCQFSIDVPGPDDYSAEGDFMDMEYTISRSTGVAATISKRFFAFSDTYGIDIADGEDVVTLLAAAVVIDLCCHGDKK